MSSFLNVNTMSLQRPTLAGLLITISLLAALFGAARLHCNTSDELAAMVTAMICVSPLGVYSVGLFCQASRKLPWSEVLSRVGLIFAWIGVVAGFVLITQYGAPPGTSDSGFVRLGNVLINLVIAVVSMSISWCLHAALSLVKPKLIGMVIYLPLLTMVFWFLCRWLGESE